MNLVLVGLNHCSAPVAVRERVAFPRAKLGEATCELLGTAKLADVPGYLVGGKTGTADKQRGRHYATNANLTSFIGVFPINDPKYLVMVMFDEPRPSASTHGFATAGWTSAPAVGRVIKQIGPLLGVQPVDENRPEIRQALEADPTNAKGTTLAAYSPDDDH